MVIHISEFCRPRNSNQRWWWRRESPWPSSLFPMGPCCRSFPKCKESINYKHNKPGRIMYQPCALFCCLMPVNHQLTKWVTLFVHSTYNSFAKVACCLFVTSRSAKSGPGEIINKNESRETAQQKIAFLLRQYCMSLFSIQKHNGNQMSQKV